MLEQDLYTVVESLVGSRVYPGRVPEGSVYPAIDFIFIEGPPDQTQQDYIRNPRVRFNVWADTYDDMLNAALALRQRLDHHIGDFSALFMGGLDLDDPETGKFHRVVDFSLWGN